jgi:hypothetical protein
MKKSRIKKNMEVIGADGVHVGTVDRVIGDRIRLIAADSGQGRHKGHHHYIQLGLVADVESDTVRLSANAANAVTFEQEASGEPIQLVRCRWAFKRHRSQLVGRRFSVISRINAQCADLVGHAALERTSASAHALH